MSSVRDRIRGFQLSEGDPDAAPPPTQPSSVSKIAKSLEASPAPASPTSSAPAPDQGIGARVRRFNATSSASPSSPAPARSIPASKSLQPGATPATFASHTSSTILVQSSNSQPVRRTASDNEDGRVSRGRTGESSEKSAAETQVGNARRKFESQQDKQNGDSSGTGPKIQVTTTTKKTTEVVTTVYSRPSALETGGTYGVPTGGSTIQPFTKENSKDGKDAVSARAAKFGKTGSSSKEVVQGMGKPEQSVHKNLSNGASAGLQDSTGSKEKNQVKEELAEVRALNEKLVKSLLDLNEQYSRLEKSRDNLQKRVAELEANAK